MKIFWFLFGLVFLAGAFCCAYSGFLKNQSDQDNMALLGFFLIIVSIILIFVRAVYPPMFKNN
jgi:hypothetical protein